MMRIMIIRHAEKPTGDGLFRGVTISGVHDKHDLSVRGWQRAGALVRFFAPLNGLGGHAPISTPRSIFASAAVAGSPSLRAKHTVSPLAEALGLPVHANHPDGDEVGVAAAMLAAEGPVLVAWHHHHIPALVREITQGALVCHTSWPEDRFDLVWVLDRPAADGPWIFAQIVQRLLANDADDVV